MVAAARWTFHLVVERRLVAACSEIGVEAPARSTKWGAMQGAEPTIHLSCLAARRAEPEPAATASRRRMNRRLFRGRQLLAAIERRAYAERALLQPIWPWVRPRARTRRTAKRCVARSKIDRTAKPERLRPSAGIAGTVEPADTARPQWPECRGSRRQQGLPVVSPWEFLTLAEGAANVRRWHWDGESAIS